MTGESSGRFLSAQDPSQRADSLIYGPLKNTLSFPYLARRTSIFSVLDPSLLDRMARMAQLLAGDARGEYVRAFYFRMRRQVQRSNELLRLAIDDYPTDDSLRKEFLNGWYNDLVNGKAPPEVVEVADGLSAPAAHLLAIERHAARAEWKDVALADTELSEIPWTDSWYAEALELRVNWRLNVSDAKQLKRLADEALTMIDRLAIMNPTLELYALRTRAALAAERPDVTLESLSNYARQARQMARAGVNTPEALRRDARALLDVLDGVARLPGMDTARVAEVRAEIGALSSN